MRDGVLTPTDYEYLKTLEAKEDEEWMKSAVTLVAENELAGAMNGEGLREQPNDIHRFRTFYNSEDGNRIERTAANPNK